MGLGFKDVFLVLSQIPHVDSRAAALEVREHSIDEMMGGASLTSQLRHIYCITALVLSSCRGKLRSKSPEI